VGVKSCAMELRLSGPDFEVGDMHAERLNTLAREILASYQEHDPIKYLQELVDAVKQRISNPSDVAFDQALSKTRIRFRQALDQLAIDRFPPIARKMMNELGLDVLFPEVIRDRMDRAFQDRFVDSEVVNALEELKKDMRGAIKSLTALREGFSAMLIGEDKLAPDDVEFNAAMPREAIDDHLGGFSKVLGLLNKELTVLASIAKYDREPLRINSISTNDFTVALNINVDLGVIVQTILLALIALRIGYRNQIEALKNPALKSMPPEILAQAVKWARGWADAEIKKIVDSLPETASDSVDPAKLEAKRELVIEAVRYMHDKQELGFNMEVRTGTPEADVTEEAEADAEKRQQINAHRAKIREISSKAATMKVLTQQNTPILTLGVDKGEGIAPEGEEEAKDE
jgi:hypothetical protein